jgi:hypothetical protein
MANENNQKSLRLSLKKKWFDMTNPNEKSEDYRELTPYWYSILCLYNGEKRSQKFWEFAPLSSMDFDSSKVSFKKFEFNIMTLGYPSNEDKERIKKFEHKGIEIRTGKEQWGSEPNKLYFVIMHGKQIIQ